MLQLVGLFLSQIGFSCRSLECFEMLNTNQSVLVAGGGGFIGGHLVADLLKRGFKKARCVEVKPQTGWYQGLQEAENFAAALNLLDECRRAVKGPDVVINLACNMGGMG